MFERTANVKLNFDSKSKRDVSRTHQSFAKEANIHTIMARYKKTGLLVDPLAVNQSRVPNFGNFSDLSDLSSTLIRIRNAESSFMTLPAKVRERFNNDLPTLLDFVNNPDNLVASIDLGLLPENLRPVPPKVVEGAAPEATPTPIKSAS